MPAGEAYIQANKKKLNSNINPKWQMMESFLGLLPNSVLEKVGVSDKKGAEFLSHYLAGSGKPKKLNLSDDYWTKLINLANETGWEKSTNPKAPQGSYHSMVSPFNLKDNLLSGDNIPSVIGETTTIRKTPTANKDTLYSIQEDFDFKQGSDKSTQYTSTRYFDKRLVELLKKFDSDVFMNWSGKKDAVRIDPTGKGKSFAIFSEYFKKRKKESK